MKAIRHYLKLLFIFLHLTVFILNIYGCGGGGGGSSSSGSGTTGGSLITVDFESLEPDSTVEILKF